LGTYDIEGLRIEIGDSSVHVVPMGRNVVGSVNPPGGGAFRAVGRVDIGDGIRKSVLHRTIQDGQDLWYAVDEERYRVTPFTRERLQEILMFSYRDIISGRRVEVVCQVRKYRNWVAHGRRKDQPEMVTPEKV
jgi:hypothetical protein